MALHVMISDWMVSACECVPRKRSLPALQAWQRLMCEVMLTGVDQMLLLQLCGGMHTFESCIVVCMLNADDTVPPPRPTTRS